MNSEETQQILTIRDVSQILHIGINQARSLVHRKDFPKIVIGKKKCIIPQAAFNEWLTHGGIGKQYFV